MLEIPGEAGFPGWAGSSTVGLERMLLSFVGKDAMVQPVASFAMGFVRKDAMVQRVASFAPSLGIDCDRYSTGNTRQQSTFLLTLGAAPGTGEQTTLLLGQLNTRDWWSNNDNTLGVVLNDTFFHTRSLLIGGRSCGASECELLLSPATCGDGEHIRSNTLPAFGPEISSIRVPPADRAGKKYSRIAVPRFVSEKATEGDDKAWSTSSFTYFIWQLEAAIIDNESGRLKFDSVASEKI